MIVLVGLEGYNSVIILQNFIAGLRLNVYKGNYKFGYYEKRKLLANTWKSSFCFDFFLADDLDGVVHIGWLISTLFHNPIRAVAKYLLQNVVVQLLVLLKQNTRLIVCTLQNTRLIVCTLQPKMKPYVVRQNCLWTRSTITRVPNKCWYYWQTTVMYNRKVSLKVVHYRTWTSDITKDNQTPPPLPPTKLKHTKQGHLNNYNTPTDGQVKRNSQ